MMTQTDLVVKVVEAVAAVDGINPAELDSLHEYIDPEILENLYELDRGEWSFTFQYSDHQVTVTHDEQILVDGRLQTSDVSTR